MFNEKENSTVNLHQSSKRGVVAYSSVSQSPSDRSASIIVGKMALAAIDADRSARGQAIDMNAKISTSSI